MPEKKSHVLLQYISLVFLTFLGNGFIWEYKKIGVENEKIFIERSKIDLERDKISIEHAKYSLEKDRTNIEASKQKISEAMLSIEKDRNRTETEKHKMEKIRETVVLREKKTDVLSKILSLTEEFLGVIKQQSANTDSMGRVVNTAMDDDLRTIIVRSALN